MKLELYPKHKTKTKHNWKSKGLNCDLLELEIIYYRYINAEFCELCNKEFKTRHDRCMDHSHETGYFRNIVCNSCNQRKSDRKLSKNNTSGYSGIYKSNDKRNKQGFTWVFRAEINGKHKTIKSSINLEKLIKFVDEWKKVNNYHT